MKIAIYFESSPREGGAFHQNINLIKIFNKYLKKKFDFTYIVSSVELKKIIEEQGCKTFFFKKNLFFRLDSFLLKFNFFKVLYKKFFIKNELEKIYYKNKFNLICFNNPSEISLLASNINFIIMLFEMQHRTNNYLPEYKGFHDHDLREIIIINAIHRAFKTIVATNKDKSLLQKFYNANEKSIEVQPYVPFLPDIYENSKDQDFNEIFLKLDIPKNKKILLYPAQFWPHKNHGYIVKAAKTFKENNIENIIFIFTGFDKGNLNFIKKNIAKENLEDYFKIFNYVDNLELISLYLNCFAIISPTYVGHSTLPLYESFYFRKNIIFTKDLLDESLKEFVYETDIMIPKDIFDKYNEILNNKTEALKKIDLANKYYNEKCSEEKLANKYENIFNELKYLKSNWDEKI